MDKIKESPDIIYLQWDDEEVSWCQDCINDTDIMYIKHSIHDEEIKKLIVKIKHYANRLNGSRRYATLQAQEIKKLREALTLIRHICFTARTGHYKRKDMEREDILLLAEKALKDII